MKQGRFFKIITTLVIPFSQMSFANNSNPAQSQPKTVLEISKPTYVYSAFDLPHNFPEAKITIAQAEITPMPGNLTPEDEDRLNHLIQANIIVGLITSKNKDGFEVWWLKHKERFLDILQDQVVNPSMQAFVTGLTLAYIADLAQSKQDPAGFFESEVRELIANKKLQDASLYTIGIMAGVGVFVGRTVYQAIVAGPFAGFINACLEKVVQPFREWGAVKGNEIFGPIGAKMYPILFRVKKVEIENTDPKIAATMALEFAKIDSLLSNDTYQLDPQSWDIYINSMREQWSQLNRIWAGVADGLKNGRDRFYDLEINRPQNFANYVTNSIQAGNSASAYADETVRYLAMANPNQRTEIIQDGELLEKTIADRFLAQQQGTEDLSQYQEIIEEIKDRFSSKYSASPKQVEKIIGYYEQSNVFFTQTVNFLVGQMIHDSSFSDTMREMLPQLKTLRKGLSLNYFHQMFSAQVKGILKQLHLQIGLKNEGTLKYKDADAVIEMTTEESVKLPPSEAIKNKREQVQAEGKTRILKFLKK